MKRILSTLAFGLFLTASPATWAAHQGCYLFAGVDLNDELNVEFGVATGVGPRGAIPVSVYATTKKAEEGLSKAAVSIATDKRICLDGAYSSLLQAYLIHSVTFKDL